MNNLKILVATDDIRIKIVEKNHFHSIMTSKCLTGTDRVAEVAKALS